jgi:tRNA (adenine37-N6)-methyltransferase
MNITFQPIGTIHTPYLPTLPIPHQPISNAPGEFWISLNPDYQIGLEKLISYRYIYVLYYLDQVDSELNLKVNPIWAPEVTVGLFASRSPNRPNPIGLSIVELKGIEENEILISGIDVYNGTLLLDIKPYVKVLDMKPDSNDGWYDELSGKDHLLAHLLNLPHEHSESSHTHEHSHVHKHGSKHSHGLASRVDLSHKRNIPRKLAKKTEIERT